MAEQWFEPEELTEMSRPTMDRAIEAIEAGDLEAAKRLCGEMKHEWLMLHDLMAESVLGLITFVQDKLGDDGVAEAWEVNCEQGWKRHHRAIESLDRRVVAAPALLAVHRPGLGHALVAELVLHERDQAEDRLGHQVVEHQPLVLHLAAEALRGVQVTRFDRLDRPVHRRARHLGQLLGLEPLLGHRSTSSVGCSTAR